MHTIRNLIAARTMVLALVAALCAIGLGNKAAWSASEKDQASVILSNLPAKESADYKALRDLAGAGESQDLDMMKSEKWSVPPERLDAFLKAAAAKGVRVTRLDENWNRVLVPMAEAEGHEDKVDAIKGSDGRQHDEIAGARCFGLRSDEGHGRGTSRRPTHARHSIER
jgi:hypothetical protein